MSDNQITSRFAVTKVNVSKIGDTHKIYCEYSSLTQVSFFDTEDEAKNYIRTALETSPRDTYVLTEIKAIITAQPRTLKIQPIKKAK